MSRWILLPILMLSSCLLVRSRPCACPGNLMCDSFGDECPVTCTWDDDCLDGFVCNGIGACEPGCSDNGDCPGGLVCDFSISRGECLEPCDPMGGLDQCEDGMCTGRGVCDSL